MAEQRSFRVEAVILRHADWGEADRLLTLFTREREARTQDQADLDWLTSTWNKPGRQGE